MPFLTSWMFALDASASLAISFIKPAFVAKKAFEESLASSAEDGDIKIILLDFY